MIRVTLRLKDGPPLVVEVADGREQAVLTRAHERIFPGPVNEKAELESEARYLAVMKARYARQKKAAKK